MFLRANPCPDADARKVDFEIAALMAVASLLGGWLGAHVAQRLPPAGMRAFAIAVGLFAAGKFLLR